MIHTRNIFIKRKLLLSTLVCTSDTDTVICSCLNHVAKQCRYIPFTKSSKSYCTLFAAVMIIKACFFFILFFFFLSYLSEVKSRVVQLITPEPTMSPQSAITEDRCHEVSTDHKALPVHILLLNWG